MGVCSSSCLPRQQSGAGARYYVENREQQVCKMGMCTGACMAMQRSPAASSWTWGSREQEAPTAVLGAPVVAPAPGWPTHNTTLRGQLWAARVFASSSLRASAHPLLTCADVPACQHPRAHFPPVNAPMHLMHMWVPGNQSPAPPPTYTICSGRRHPAIHLRRTVL